MVAVHSRLSARMRAWTAIECFSIILLIVVPQRCEATVTLLILLTTLVLPVRLRQVGTGTESWFWFLRVLRKKESNSKSTGQVALSWYGLCLCAFLVLGYPDSSE